MKRKLNVGRTKYRVNVYFWWSEATEKKIGQFFPSRKAAICWRDQAFWRYQKYPVLEQFLATVPKTMWIRERVWWNRHRDNYLDLSLEKGAVTYIGKKFDDKRKKLKEKKNDS